MSEKENTSKKPKKIGPITLNKKNTIKSLIILGIISSCVFGVNSYLSYKHQMFLEEHSNAILSIQNEDKEAYKESFEILSKLADNNNATTEDYFYLGYLYQYGYGTQKNYSYAYKYYKKATTKDYPKAYYQIAILYKDGLGVNKNDKKAIDYLKKSYDLGYKKSIITLAQLIENNNVLISIVEPEILYEIYLAYNSNMLIETTTNAKIKYLTTAAREGYEPAIIIQARNFSKAGDNYRSLMLWQTLLYSSDPKVSELAKKQIVKVNKQVNKQIKKQQEEETKKQAQERLEEEKIFNQKRLEKIKRNKQIQYKKNVGLSIPKQELKDFNGLIYLNLFNVDKALLQQFYKSITNIYIPIRLINNSKNISNNYMNDFFIISKLKHNKSSLRIDFGNQNNNKYEGMVYYFYNDKSNFTQNILNSIIKNINPKKSSLTPIIINPETGLAQQTYLNNIRTKNIQEEKQNNTQEEIEDNIQLTHEEQIQRMQVFAQKGDFREFYKLEQAAKADDVYAIYYVGKYYYNIKEFDKALKYYEKAADKNYGPAYYKLASLYYNEEKNGVPYDKDKAMHYYKKAADLGVRNAKHILMLIK